MKTLICEICQQPIATFDPDKVKLPLEPGMFEPYITGMPPPFHHSLGVFDFRCGWCQKLPFVAEFNTAEDVDPEKFPARLKTRDGYHSLIEPILEAVREAVIKEGVRLDDLKCRYCGKQYKQDYWLRKHEAICPKK